MGNENKALPFRQPGPGAKVKQVSPLLVATQAIADKYAQKGGANGFLGNAASDVVALNGGFCTHYAGGSIYWSSSTGAHEVHGDIRGKWSALGWERGFLGYPLSDETGAPDGTGRYNHFQGGSIYWTPEAGAHEVHGDIGGKWSALGWERGFLGYPLSDEIGTPDGMGRYNHFQGGSIYWTPETGAHEVHGDIRGKWSALGWERGFLGYPTTDQTGAPDGIGRYNDFQGGSIYWTPSTGTHEVRGVLPDQLSVDSGPIVFPAGVAAGGRSQVTIKQNGTVQFKGAMHDSGTAAYKYGVACVIMDADNRPYTFGKTGWIAGTFESGSRDDPWDETTQNSAVAQNWRSLAARAQGTWQSEIDLDGAKLVGAILLRLLATASPPAGLAIAIFS